MFGELLFATTPFATVGELVGQYAWTEICPAESVWGTVDASVDSWNNQPTSSETWEYPDKSDIPIRRCD